MRRRLHLTFADERFAADTGIAVGTPLLHREDGSLNEEVLAHFNHRKRTAGVSAGTMRAEAFTLRRWFEWCMAHRRAWDRPEDAWLREFTEAPPVGARGDPGRDQCVILSFYADLVAAYPWEAGGRPRRRLVAGVGEQVPVGAGMLTCQETGDGSVWSGWEPTRRKPGPLDVPGNADMDEFLKRLGRIEPDASRTWGDGSGRMLAARNRLIGRCMCHAGLRCEEVANLGMPALWCALRDGGLCPPPGGADGWPSLDAMAADEEARRRLAAGLERRRDTHGDLLWIDVRGKGSKWRAVPFPIDLVTELVVVAVFDLRRNQLAHWGSRRGGFAIPPEVLLSGRGPMAMTADSVGRAAKAAFAGEPVIAGTPHRCRANFGTNTAFRVLGERLASSGGVINDHLIDTVLDEVARCLGHEHPTTSVRFYVAAALSHRELHSWAGNVLSKLLDGVAADLAKVAPGCLELVGRMIARLASANEHDVDATALRMLLDRMDARDVGPGPARA